MIRPFTVLCSIFLASFIKAQDYTSVHEPTSRLRVPNDSSYRRQLKLVDSICQFIRTDLKLNIGDAFYTTWSSRTDSMYNFLYVSRNDTIASPVIEPKGLWYFDREDMAISKSNEIRKLGHQTLVYKTAGLSNTMLNRKLLSYPDEAIAFILFHEATHRHIGMGIDYNFTEALCDAMANKACIRFAKKTKMLDLRKVKLQKMKFENAYAYLNKKRGQVENTVVPGKQDIFNQCNSKIGSLIQSGNQFVKDRMGYEVNNAYFLRVEAYALHYFEMKELLGKNLEINKVIPGLPKIKRTVLKEIDVPKTNSLDLPLDSLKYQWNSW